MELFEIIVSVFGVVILGFVVGFSLGHETGREYEKMERDLEKVLK